MTQSAICHNGTNWWWVRIHATQPEMLATANDLHVRRGGSPNHNPPDTQACFQPAAFWYHVPDNDGPMTPARRNGYVGTMRLVRGHINTEIMAHECVHLSLRIYRARHDEQASFGPGCGEQEEDLAYIIGETVRTMTNLLYELGDWSTAN